MKRCRTPREKEEWKTDTLCVTSRVYKGAYHQSVSSWCTEKMKYHVKGAERRSYRWHLIWRFSAQEHKHNDTQLCHTHTHTQEGAAQERNTPLCATSLYTNTHELWGLWNMHIKPCTQIYCDLLFFLIIWRVCARRRCLGLGDNTRARSGGVGLSSPDYQAMI